MTAFFSSVPRSFILLGVLGILLVPSACRSQPTSRSSVQTGAFAPSDTRTLREFGATGDGRSDDTAAMQRAFADSDRYCIDGERRAYLVRGTLRVAKDLCLRNATFIQAAVGLDTTPYVNRDCPKASDPSAVVDCKDAAVPAGLIDPLWRSLTTRTLLIRPQGDRPLRIKLESVKIDRGVQAEGGSRTDAAGIWLDGADRVDFQNVEITGNGKGYGLLITNSRNVTLNDLWIHDLVWAPYRGDKPLLFAEVASQGWNSVPIHEFREKGRGGSAGAKFYGVRIQEQLACASLSSVSNVRINNIRIERCLARFDKGDLPWQADGLDIGRSSSDVFVNGARVDSAWEGVDVVAGGKGIERLHISNLAVTNAFSFGLKMGQNLRNATATGVRISRAGLSGIVIYGSARNIRVSRASISDVGILTSPKGTYSPWPAGNRAGIRIDGNPPSAPRGVTLEDIEVTGEPSQFEFGILNTGGSGIQVERFVARGFRLERAHSVTESPEAALSAQP